MQDCRYIEFRTIHTPRTRICAGARTSVTVSSVLATVPFGPLPARPPPLAAAPPLPPPVVPAASSVAAVAGRTTSPTPHRPSEYKPAVWEDSAMAAEYQYAVPFHAADTSTPDGERRETYTCVDMPY
jgi:hypothetical protein